MGRGGGAGRAAGILVAGLLALPAPASAAWRVAPPSTLGDAAFSTTVRLASRPAGGFAAAWAVERLGGDEAGVAALAGPDGVFAPTVRVFPFGTGLRAVVGSEAGVAVTAGTGSSGVLVRRQVGSGWEVADEVDSPFSDAEVLVRGDGSAVAAWLQQVDDLRFEVRVAERPAGGAWSASSVIGEPAVGRGSLALATSGDAVAVLRWVDQTGAGTCRGPLDVAVRTGAGWTTTAISPPADDTCAATLAVDEVGAVTVAWVTAGRNVVLAHAAPGGAVSRTTWRLPLAPRGVVDVALAARDGRVAAVTQGGTVRARVLEGGRWSAPAALGLADAGVPSVVVAGDGSVVVAFGEAFRFSNAAVVATRAPGGAFRRLAVVGDGLARRGDEIALAVDAGGRIAVGTLDEPRGARSARAVAHLISRSAGRARRPRLAAPRARPVLDRNGGLTCLPRAWLDATAFAYVWLRDGRVLRRTTRSQIALRAVDGGHAFRCRVVATGPGGTAAAESASVRV